MSYRHHVRYHEIDAQGVMYNAHYLTLFDIAVSELMRDLGHPFPEPGADFDYHTVHAEVDYRRPVRLDEIVDVTARVGKLGRSSIHYDLAVTHGAEAEPRATGKIVWVHADQRTGRSAELPGTVRASLEATT